MPGVPVDIHQQPHCFACGADNPSGLHLKLGLDGDDVLGFFTPDHRHEGAPGLLHGGVMAALFDEVLGQTTKHVGAAGVTASLSVQYRAPVPLGHELVLRCRLARREGRKLFLEGEAHLDDLPVADATGLWIAVDPSHFERAASHPV